MLIVANITIIPTPNINIGNFFLEKCAFVTIDKFA